MQTLEEEIVKYVIEKKGAFPEKVFEYFGRYREDAIRKAIESVVGSGEIVEKWIDDTAMGGVKYSILLPLKVL